MNKTLLTKELINNATIETLEALAVEYGIEVSGATTESLKEQLLALVPGGSNKAFNGKRLPKKAANQKSAKEEKTVDDNSSESDAENQANDTGSQQEQESADVKEQGKEEAKQEKKPEKSAQQLRIEKLLKEDPSKLFKVQRLDYIKTKDENNKTIYVYKWNVELLEKTDKAPVSNGSVVSIICKMMEATYTMPGSCYAEIKDKTIVDDYKLKAIIESVLSSKSPKVYNDTVNYFRMLGLVVPATLSTKRCFFVTPKAVKKYEAIMNAAELG